MAFSNWIRAINVNSEDAARQSLPDFSLLLSFDAHLWNGLISLVTASILQLKQGFHAWPLNWPLNLKKKTSCHTWSFVFWPIHYFFPYFFFTYQTASQKIEKLSGTGSAVCSLFLWTRGHFCTFCFTALDWAHNRYRPLNYIKTNWAVHYPFQFS